MKNDYQSLKVGDQVIVRRSLNFNHDTYATIERLTKTQIILKNSDKKYKRKTGSLIGGSSWSYHTEYLIIADKKEIAKIKSTREKKKCISVLIGYKWTAFDLEFLREMIALIELKQNCVHGKGKSEYCQLCGRINNKGE